METEDNSNMVRVRPISIVAPTSVEATLEQNEFNHNQPEMPPNVTLNQQPVFNPNAYGTQNLGSLVHIQSIEKQMHSLQEIMQNLQANLSQLAMGQQMSDQTCQSLHSPVSHAQSENCLGSKKDFYEKLEEQLKQQTIETQPQDQSSCIPMPPPLPSILPKEPTKSSDKPYAGDTNKGPLVIPNKPTTTDAICSELNHAILNGSLTLRKTERKEKTIFDKDMHSSELKFKTKLKSTISIASSAGVEGRTIKTDQDDCKEVSPLIEEIRKKKLARRHSMLVKTSKDLEHHEKVQLVEPFEPMKKRNAGPEQQQSKLDEDKSKNVFPFATLRCVANKPSWCVTNELLTSNELTKTTCETEDSETTDVTKDVHFTSKLCSEIKDEQREVKLAKTLKSIKKSDAPPKQQQCKSEENQIMNICPFGTKLRCVTNKPSWCVTKESLTSNEITIASSETENKNSDEPKVVHITPKLRSVVKKPAWYVRNENQENFLSEQPKVVTNNEEKKISPMRKPARAKGTTASKTSLSTSVTTISPTPTIPPIANETTERPIAAVAVTASDSNNGAILAAIQGSQKDSLQTPLPQMRSKSSNSSKQISDVSTGPENDRKGLLSQIQGFKRDSLRHPSMNANKPSTTSKGLNLNLSKIMESALNDRFRALNGGTTDDSGSDSDDTDQASTTDEDEWADCEE